MDCEGAWMDSQGEYDRCQRTCKRMFSFFSVQFLNKEVFIQVIDGAGHHVYADQKDEFNALVLRKCEETDPAGVGHR
jgi:hypothetical protein